MELVILEKWNDNSNRNGYMEIGNDINQEVIDKIFDMMENFTGRMMEIENNLWYDNTKSWHQINENWIIPEHKF